MPAINAKRTEPSRSAINQAAGFKYTTAASTDLAKRFAAIRREQAKALRDSAQAQLELETSAQVLPLFKQVAG